MRGTHLSDRPDSCAISGPSPRAWDSPPPRCAQLGTPAVHPHVRGTHSERTASYSSFFGPSPRAWDSPRCGWSRSRWCRSIPTCVGLTAEAIAAEANESVHPHVRGTHGEPVVTVTVSDGPSPRAWDSPLLRRTARGGLRSIPTCVGLTCWSRGGRKECTVHPHVRGTHNRRSLSGGASCGPSPRAWDSLTRRRPHVVEQRSIPTCVGLTSSAASPTCSSSVHPHVRGTHENEVPDEESDPVHPHVRGTHPGRDRRHGLDAGPSPRAWDSRPPRVLLRRTSRSIPTCVGLTAARRPRTASAPVHPHVRGTHGPLRPQSTRLDGPSPRAWDSPGGNAAKVIELRSIPTCVGLTATSRRIRWQSAVHPHVRGTHSSTALSDMPESGPSPRAWDSPLLVAAGLSGDRSIPTCVGLTDRLG